MASLNREAILARRSSLPREPVEVPELEGTVWVRVLTLREVSEIQREQRAKDSDPMKLYPKLIALGCVNEDGSPVFGPNDHDAINELPWSAVDTIAKAVLRISKMGPEESGDPKD